MNYKVDASRQLSEGIKRGYKSQVARLRAAGTPTRQHNVDPNQAMLEPAQPPRDEEKSNDKKKSDQDNSGQEQEKSTRQSSEKKATKQTAAKKSTATKKK